MQAKLADMYVTMNAAKSYVYAVARACDEGRTTREDAAGAILYAAERATWMALEAIQCLGGNGYINEFPTGRLLRDAKLYEIGAGTSEIRRMLIGREIFEKTRSEPRLLPLTFAAANQLGHWPTSPAMEKAMMRVRLEGRRADRGNPARRQRKDRSTIPIRRTFVRQVRARCGLTQAAFAEKHRGADRDRAQLGAGQAPSARARARAAQADRQGAGAAFAALGGRRR